MSEPRVQQLKILIAQSQQSRAEHERQLSVTENSQTKLELRHKVADLSDQIESYEEELAELGSDDDDAEVAIWTSANFESEVLQSDLPVLVDCWAEWCGPCKQLTPLIAELAREFKGQVKFGKLNVDEEAQVATLLNVQSLPTLIILDQRRIVAVLTGAITYPQIYSRLQQITKN